MTQQEMLSLRELIRKVNELTAKVEHLDTKLDTVESKLDAAQGALGVMRWIGFGGLVALMVAVVKANGG